MGKIENDITESLNEAIAYIKGDKSAGKETIIHIPEEIDVKKIRRSLHMSQKEFAGTFGFNKRTLERYESGDRHPTGHTRAYLKVISAFPDAVFSVLRDNNNHV